MADDKKENAQVIKPSVQDLKDEILWGLLKGQMTGAAISAPALAMSLSASKSLIPMDDLDKIQKVISEVEKKNPNLFVKILDPNVSDDMIENSIAKIRNMLESRYVPSSAQVGTKVSPSWTWHPNDKMLSRVEDALDLKNRAKIISSSDTATLLHELGHADDLATNVVPKMSLRKWGPLVGAGLAMASPSVGLEEYAPLIAASGFAPMLFQEGVASAKAIKNLKQHWGTGEAITGALKLLPAFATYAALPIGAYYGVKKALQSYKDIEQEKANKYRDLFTKQSHIKLGYVASLGFKRKLKELFAQ